VVLVVLAVFGVAALQAWVGQDGLRAAELEGQVQHEYERLTLLRAQVAQLSSPQRLREEAAKLGLVPAPDPAHLRVTVPAGTGEALGATTARALESASP
jgi:cell division protein FtsL